MITNDPEIYIFKNNCDQVVIKQRNDAVGSIEDHYILIEYNEIDDIIKRLSVFSQSKEG